MSGLDPVYYGSTVSGGVNLQVDNAVVNQSLTVNGGQTNSGSSSALTTNTLNVTGTLTAASFAPTTVTVGDNGQSTYQYGGIRNGIQIYDNQNNSQWLWQGGPGKGVVQTLNNTLDDGSGKLTATSVTSQGNIQYTNQLITGTDSSRYIDQFGNHFLLSGDTQRFVFGGTNSALRLGYPENGGPSCKTYLNTLDDGTGTMNIAGPINTNGTTTSIVFSGASLDKFGNYVFNSGDTGNVWGVSQTGVGTLFSVAGTGAVTSPGTGPGSLSCGDLTQLGTNAFQVQICQGTGDTTWPLGICRGGNRIFGVDTAGNCLIGNQLTFRFPFVVLSSSGGLSFGFNAITASTGTYTLPDPTNQEGGTVIVSTSSLATPASVTINMHAATGNGIYYQQTTAPTFTMPTMECIFIITDGSSWYIVSP